MLLGHNSRADQEMPIGSFREVKIRDLGVEVEGELLEEHPKHKLIMAALAKGLLMWSIGFIPVKGRRPTADELKAHGDDLEFVWEEIELIEISLVTIGSNRQAIAALREMQSRYVRTELVDADYEEVLAKMVEVNDKLNSRLRSVRPLTRKSFDEHREKIMKVCSDFVVALDGALKALGDEVGGGEPEGDKPEGDKPAEGGNGNGGTPPPPPPPKKDTTAEALLNDATAQVKALFAGDGANPPEEV
jgi:HK97 family phage prohead protease